VRLFNSCASNRRALAHSVGIGMTGISELVMFLLMLNRASALCDSASSPSSASCDATHVASDRLGADSTDDFHRQIGKDGDGVIGHPVAFSSLSRSSSEGGALAAVLPRALDGVHLAASLSSAPARGGREEEPSMRAPPNTSPMDSVPSETPSTSTDGSVPGGWSCKMPRRASPATQQSASVPPAVPELDLAAQQSASVPPAEYEPPASSAAMSVPEAIVQGSPHLAARNASVTSTAARNASVTAEAIVQESPQPAAPTWISVPPGNPCQDPAAQLNASATPASVVQEPMQGPWWISLLDLTWITIFLAGMSLLMRAAEWVIKPTPRKSKQPKFGTARCDEAAQQKASVPAVVFEPHLATKYLQQSAAGQVAAVCPLTPCFARPIMVTDATSNDIKFDEATKQWQCVFHEWVRMLWYSREWFNTNADTPVGGWGEKDWMAHYDPEDGDVVISRQEFARLLWRCESMGDRPPICQWVAPDECPDDIFWRT